MKNKPALIRALGLVLTLTLVVSCIPIKRKAKIRADRLPGPGLAIVALQTKAGEKLTFSRKTPAYLIRDRVLISDSRKKEDLVLPKDKVKEIKAAGKYFAVEMAGGATYVGRGPYNPNTALTTKGTIYNRSIPLEDIELVWIKKTNWPLTIAASLVFDAALAVGLIVTSGGFDIGFPQFPSAEGSCPLIFSHNGGEYVLDAEPYGGAFSRGLERAEWVSLDNLRPVDGRYRLLMTNEADETDRTDELKLVVVDHGPDVAVVPDVMGRMRTFGASAPPLAATETASGRDVLSLVSTRDDRFWVSRMEGKDPANDGDLKDTLVLEFAKPAGARKAKLLANVWNTAWGVGAAKTLLEARGRTLPAWLAEVDARGPAYRTAMNWYARENMFTLQARVETTAGWKTKALILGSGAAVAKDKAYEIDLADVPGDRVRIELTPAAGFWMIDRLALDFTADRPVRVTEIAPDSAVEGGGCEVAAELAGADGRYQVLEKTGDRAEIVFTAPPQDPGTARTVFVKARGYYDIHLNIDAEPDAAAVRTLDTPGESLRYVLARHPVVAAAIAAKAGQARTEAEAGTGAPARRK